jgi:electron transfer flavoprotein-quinone oxidoreductase
VAEGDRVDVVIVGAGLAGLACAWTLLGHGVEVLVLERGDQAGAKNLSGGRLYHGPLESLELLDGAPYERVVTRESIALVAGGAVTQVSFASDRLAEPERRSSTVLRARLDAWLADRVSGAGGVVATGTLVDGLVRDDGGTVRGVVAQGEEILARVVVAADGALSAMARHGGLRSELEPSQLALGIKALYSLDAGKIEDRFCLAPGEGAAELVVGEITSGLPGGAFLYTNRDSLSLGVVVRLDALASDAAASPPDLLHAIEQRPEIARRIAGAELVEYGAHLVPEAAPDRFGRRVADGLVVVGDAAGLVINHGITVRGMDLALVSGVLAGQAIAQALEQDDASRAALSRYDDLLRDSTVGQDIGRFAGSAETLSRSWLTRDLPAIAADMAAELYSFGPGPKERLSTTAWRHLRRRVLRLGMLGELLRLRRL